MYFSELTLYSDGGFGWIDAVELNQRYTDIWDLGKVLVLADTTVWLAQILRRCIAGPIDVEWERR